MVPRKSDGILPDDARARYENSANFYEHSETRNCIPLSFFSLALSPALFPCFSPCIGSKHDDRWEIRVSLGNFDCQYAKHDTRVRKIREHSKRMGRALSWISHGVSRIEEFGKSRRHDVNLFPVRRCFVAASRHVVVMRVAMDTRTQVNIVIFSREYFSQEDRAQSLSAK